jgi:hypothetical protein
MLTAMATMMVVMVMAILSGPREPIRRMLLHIEQSTEQEAEAVTAKPQYRYQ